METIRIEEIPVEKIDSFWEVHYRYLVDDGIVEDEEDKEYFAGSEYRDVIKTHMERNTDRHHMVWFVREDTRIGAAQYCTYHSEDGKCFLMDFWVFPVFRGKGTGHRCFEVLDAYVKADGAVYYEINCEKEDAHRFWESLGFRDSGVDEYDMPLMERR